MKNILFTLVCFVLLCGVGLAQPCEVQAQVAQKTKPPTKRVTPPTPPRPPVDMAELIFKRMDANHDGSISLKEFKTAFPRMRQSHTRGSSPSRGNSQGQTRGFDGKAPGFRSSGGRSRGDSRGNSFSRGRSHRGKSKGDINGKDK